MKGHALCDPMCTENPEQAHPLRESRSGLPGAGRGVSANVEYQFGVNILELDGDGCCPTM